MAEEWWKRKTKNADIRVLQEAATEVSSSFRSSQHFQLLAAVLTQEFDWHILCPISIIKYTNRQQPPLSHSLRADKHAPAPIRPSPFRKVKLSSGLDGTGNRSRVFNILAHKLDMSRHIPPCILYAMKHALTDVGPVLGICLWQSQLVTVTRAFPEWPTEIR